MVKVQTSALPKSSIYEYPLIIHYAAFANTSL